MHCQPSELLQCVQHLTLAADELVQVSPAVDAHDRAVALDVQIDIAVEVQQVQQLLEIVAGDLALGHQLVLEIRRRLGGLLDSLLDGRLVRGHGF